MSQAGKITVAATVGTGGVLFATDNGSAATQGNTIEIFGEDGGPISTSGSGGTVTLEFDASGIPSIPTTFQTENGSAVPETNILEVSGAGGVTLSASGNVLTITGAATENISYPTDSGTASPTGNSMNLFGGTGINTSGIVGQASVNLDVPVTVANGGTERTSHTAYAVICGGTTSTGAQQSIASVGSSGQVLTSNGAGSLPTMQDPAGDVSAGANLTDNAIVRGDGGGKDVQDSGILVDDSDNVTGMGSLDLDGDITNYQAVNDANPEFRLGSADAEELHIQSVYDSGAQTLDYVLYKTDTASGTDNKGLHRFNVDGADIVDINDNGLDVSAGQSYLINSTNVLNATTLGSGVINSSLTSVGTLATGTWNADTIAEGYGGTNQTTYATGDLLYSSASNTLSKLGIGSTNEVLTVSGGVPSWQASQGGSGWTLIESQDASTDSSLDFTTGIDSDHDEYFFELINLLFSTTAYLDIRTSSDGGSSWDSSSGNYQWSALSGSLSGSASQIRLITNDSDSNYSINGNVRMFRPSGTTHYKSFLCTVGYRNVPDVVNGERKSTSAIDGVRFLPDSGTITSGTIRLWGLPKT